ncbi:hypothetical protein C8J56DRAFT_917845 [Mycena floridula]|nr:hypothetical protein C8J56DRAFT_917845 [Mycena floridula]
MSRGNRSRPNRGSPRVRGGGRGGRGRGRGRGRGAEIEESMDFVLQQWPDSNSQSHRASPRGTIGFSPRGRGRQTGPSRGNGAPLSQLLHLERPLLRPIIFVPSQQSKYLFQVEEEILQPIVEDVGDEEESHVPTADRVARVFSGGFTPQAEISSDDEEELQEIDFSDMAQFDQHITSIKPTEVAAEEQFTGSYVKPPSPVDLEGPGEANEGSPSQTISTMFETGFYIDIERRTTEPSMEPEILVDHSNLVPLGMSTPAEDEEIIVYVAPHPRNGRIQPVTPVESSQPPQAQTPPPYDAVSFSFTPSPSKRLRKPAPVFNVHGHTKAKFNIRRQQGFSARRKAGGSSFAMLGANVSEAQMRGNSDPKWNDRRRGDSDVDWDDSDQEESAETVGASGAEGMDLDPELDFSIADLKRFVQTMGQDGGRFKTMDDIADEQRMKEEDLDQENSDEDSEEDIQVDAIVNEEEGIMVGDAGADEVGDDDDDDDDGDEDEDDDSSEDDDFEHRLQQLRKVAQDKRKRSPDEEVTWADADDDYIAMIEEMLENSSNVKVASSSKKTFDEYLDDDPMFDGFITGKRRKNKHKDLPDHLQDQWEKDRRKKADRKRQRQLDRLEAAADPLAYHKGGKKGRKAMKAAARLDPTIIVIPNRVIDMSSLVQQIRRFINDLSGPSSMSLPPTNKETRKNIHELAVAFGLKSVSKGKGDARYTSLIKTTRSGYPPDEKKIGRIVRRGGGNADFVRVRDKSNRHDGSGPRHKEGDEVGKTAPKIGESNVGFQMLAMMGWSEGDRIGLTGGLKDPLTAVIKNTKLGLGALKK